MLQSTVSSASRPANAGDMVYVPGGTFWMGSDRHYPEEAPAHRVTVAGFWMDRHPVTNRKFRECCALLRVDSFATAPKRSSLAPRAGDSRRERPPRARAHQKHPDRARLHGSSGGGGEHLITQTLRLPSGAVRVPTAWQTPNALSIPVEVLKDFSWSE